MSSWRLEEARCQPSPESRKQLVEVEAQIGTLPLSLHMWYEIVGSVDFTGLFPPSLMKALFDEHNPINSAVSELPEVYIRVLGRQQNPYSLYSDA